MIKRSMWCLPGLLALCACAAPGPTAVEARLPALGHRNWILIADAAYPAQTGAGIEVVYVGGDQLAAVASVLDAVDAAAHVRANVRLDVELAAVPAAEVAGIEDYRRSLHALLRDREVTRDPHGDLIAAVARASASYRVLVLKTDCVMPYTTVFVELDCGYWSAEQEARLRASQR